VSRFFFSAKFENRKKISGRKLKKEKKVGAKVGKKGVSYTTNSLLCREPFSGTQAMESGNPYFFWPRNSFCRKIFGTKLEIVKIFGMKSEKSKKNPGESLYARIFPDENETCRKMLGRIGFGRENVQTG